MTLCSGAVCNATLTKKKTMEKFNKHPYFPIRTLAACTAAALTVLLPTHASATTFDQQPLVGVGSVYPPNILLALSVEYPTAGAAYEAANIWNPKGKRQLNEQKFDQSKSFIGYFDSGKVLQLYRQRGQCLFHSRQYNQQRQLRRKYL